MNVLCQEIELKVHKWTIFDKSWKRNKYTKKAIRNGIAYIFGDRSNTQMDHLVLHQPTFKPKPGRQSKLTLTNIFGAPPNGSRNHLKIQDSKPQNHNRKEMKEDIW